MKLIGKPFLHTTVKERLARDLLGDWLRAGMAPGSYDTDEFIYLDFRWRWVVGLASRSRVAVSFAHSRVWRLINTKINTITIGMNSIRYRIRMR